MKGNDKIMQFLGFVEKASVGFLKHYRFKESCFGKYCKEMGMLAEIKMLQLELDQIGDRKSCKLKMKGRKWGS